MPTKILIVESPAFKVSSVKWPAAEAIQVNQIKDILPGISSGHLLVIGGPETKDDPQLIEFLHASVNTFSFLQFSRPEDAVLFSSRLAFLQSENRSAGVKEALAKGSTIFTETFLGAGSLGAKLDACHEIAKKTLKPDAALCAWASLQAMVFLGLRSQPASGDAKVDMQIGSDGGQVACSVQFSLSRDRAGELRRHPILETLRAAAGFFELRYHKEGEQLEIFSVFFAGENPDWPIECHTFVPSTPLEDAQAVKEYSFRLLSAREGAADPMPVNASPFKKKFSEKMRSSALSAEPETNRGPIVRPAAKLAQSAGSGKNEKALEQRSQEPLRPETKDQLLQKIKDLELKLIATTDERNSTIMHLERQLDEQKNKTKEMSKQITELTAQIKDAA